MVEPFLRDERLVATLDGDQPLTKPSRSRDGICRPNHAAAPKEESMIHNGDHSHNTEIGVGGSRFALLDRRFSRTELRERGCSPTTARQLQTSSLRPPIAVT